MTILIPRFKDNFIRGGGSIPLPAGRISGAFKCTLTGEDGRIKYDGPWQDNLVTNYGTSRLRYSDWTNYLLIGAGTTPPAITDTLIESYLAGASGASESAGFSNSGAPDYIRTSMTTHTYGTGVGTGTVTELGFAADNAFNAPITTHALLDIPIVKGASDELAITYKVILHPSTADVTGVISIGGEDYNYTVRGSNFDYVPASNNHPNFGWQDINYRNRMFEGGIGTIETYPTGADIGYASGFSKSYGGTLGGYYTDNNWSYGVDDHNGDEISSMWLRLNWNCLASVPWTTAVGWQVNIGKVSDGTGIQKVNTHSGGFTFRMYSDRYTP